MERVHAADAGLGIATLAFGIRVVFCKAQRPFAALQSRDKVPSKDHPPGRVTLPWP